MNRPPWLLWWTFTVLWSAALVSPVSGPAIIGTSEEMRLTIKFLMAKTAHVLFYLVWTILTGWLRPSLVWRFLLLFFLLHHAVVTELIQSFIPAREGSMRDIGLDHLGIFVGFLFSRRWWIENSPRHDPT